MRDTVTIADHVAERGSEAERVLHIAHAAIGHAANAADENARRYWCVRVGVRLVQAARAPGYLGPATDKETPDAR